MPLGANTDESPIGSNAKTKWSLGLGSLFQKLVVSSVKVISIYEDGEEDVLTSEKMNSRSLRSITMEDGKLGAVEVSLTVTVAAVATIGPAILPVRRLRIIVCVPSVIPSFANVLTIVPVLELIVTDQLFAPPEKSAPVVVPELVQ